MTNEEWQNHEIRNRINSGTASDSDFNTLAADKSFDRNWLGPQGQAAYDAAVARLNSSTSGTTANADTSGTTANANTSESNIQPDPNELKKQLRKQYANDNEGYLKALKDNNIAVSNPSGKVRSIQEAYYDGGIDKSTRDYMMADAIAKFARNTGRDIGNIGAQFTGGAINNSYETPAWNDRNTELFKQKTSSEAAGIKGSDKNAQRRQENANAYGTELSNTKNERVLDFSKKVKEMANDARKKGDANTALILDYLAASAAGGNLSYADLAGALAAGNASDVVPGSQNQGEVKSQATEKDYTEAINDLKDSYPGLSDEEYVEAVKEAENQALSAGSDQNKQLRDAKALEDKLKEKSKAAQKFNEAVNYFTTDQRFLNFHDGMEGFDPNNPTPEQIALLKRIAANRNAFNWKEREYAKAYLTKMGLF